MSSFSPNSPSLVLSAIPRASISSSSDSDSDSDSDEKPKKKAAKKDSSSGSGSEDEGPKEEEAKPAAEAAPAVEDDGNFELFVKSLSFDTDENSLRAHFEQYGELTKCRLIMSQGFSKGIGFVEFTNKADAAKAMNESNGFWLDNRQI